MDGTTNLLIDFTICPADAELFRAFLVQLLSALIQFSRTFDPLPPFVFNSF